MARSVMYVAIMKNQNTQIDVYTIINCTQYRKQKLLAHVCYSEVDHITCMCVCVYVCMRILFWSGIHAMEGPSNFLSASVNHAFHGLLSATLFMVVDTAVLFRQTM